MVDVLSMIEAFSMVEKSMESRNRNKKLRDGIRNESKANF